MKVLKIFGIVVGIHLAALILCVAIPGCSSTSKPAPAPEDTAMHTDAAPAIAVPPATPTPVGDAGSGYGPLPAAGFDPNAPAAYAGGSSAGGVRFMPTRPNTPAASAVQAAPVENVTPATTYTVKAGDNLWELGKRFRTDYREIAAANNMKAGAVLHEGQKLLIPKKSSTAKSASAASVPAAAPAPTYSAPAPKPESAKSASGEVTHVVQPGETIGAIARNFGVSAKELALHNNITDPLKLRAGTTLNIPSGTGWRSVSSKSGSAAPAPAPQTPKEIPNILEQEQPAPAAPTETSSVPVIKIDENSATPPQP
ncbi:LysM peptidoglycan-binding domain-containing protein [Opitutus sp. ER46]|uniref:LysM peptidoglycan-binding domain-containing protein n=1 Tax=Opitutus sp. ER46 TaxID=2161864 RepID=UPI000D319F6D|nr:LysM peptidoglycan-binding domain-containing protein [Opitutus sp. ER46]PTX90796.1 hypothetical protein DB354_19275 [Opitutus sp. ER46]